MGEKKLFSGGSFLLESGSLKRGAVLWVKGKERRDADQGGKCLARW